MRESPLALSTSDPVAAGRAEHEPNTATFLWAPHCPPGSPDLAFRQGLEGLEGTGCHLRSTLVMKGSAVRIRASALLFAGISALFDASYGNRTEHLQNTSEHRRVSESWGRGFAFTLRERLAAVKGDVDPESSVRAGAGGDMSVVCIGDCLGDRESEPKSDREAAGLRRKSLEGFEQPREFVGGSAHPRFRP